MAEYVLAAVIGCLFSVGTFLILRRDLIRVVWGTIMLSQAANIYLIAMGGLGGKAPIVSHGSGHGELVTDPVVQALVLTAIVIGFGTTAFILVLTYRIYQEHSTLDLDKIGSMDKEVAEQK